MMSIMAKLSPPEQEYLEHAMSVKSYLPPGKEYQPPTKLIKNQAPTDDYMEFMTKQFLDMKVPHKNYKAPKSTKMKPPTSSYEKSISDYLASFHTPK